MAGVWRLTWLVYSQILQNKMLKCSNTVENSIKCNVFKSLVKYDTEKLRIEKVSFCSDKIDGTHLLPENKSESLESSSNHTIARPHELWLTAYQRL